MSDYVMSVEEALEKIEGLKEFVKQHQIRQQGAKKKTGVVLSVEGLKYGDTVYRVWLDGKITDGTVINTKHWAGEISQGSLFYDEETALKAKRLRELEQELRIAQEADGGKPDWGKGTIKHVLFWSEHVKKTFFEKKFHKVAFNTEQARNKFYSEHTEEDLKLLIMGI